jgi:hypothetical protein
MKIKVFLPTMDASHIEEHASSSTLKLHTSRLYVILYVSCKMGSSRMKINFDRNLFYFQIDNFGEGIMNFYVL